MPKKSNETTIKDTEMITYLKSLTEVQKNSNKMQERIAIAVEKLANEIEKLVLTQQTLIEVMQDDESIYMEIDDDESGISDDEEDIEADDTLTANDIMLENKELKHSEIAQILNKKNILNDNGKRWHYKQIEKRLTELVKG